MKRIKSGMRALAVMGAIGLLAACSSYPAEPRYSIYADGPAAPVAAPTYSPAMPAPSGEGVRGATRPETEVAPPIGAPVEAIEGGALSAPVNTAPRRAYSNDVAPAAGPASEGYSTPPPPARGTAVAAGAAYQIQAGDTISGIGRRFQTPVQALIDLNALGPRAAVTPGQRIVLPGYAVDIGGDPYATGPSPMGVVVPFEAAPPPPPPPPPPPTAMASLPPPRAPAATVATNPTPTGPAATTVALDWPVRGEIVRRFGPVGLGERNNGINIGAPAGAEVRAAAEGRVGYVGDDLAGQGLTVLIVHRDGWRSVYGHLGSATVRDGDNIRAGQQIGTVGNTAGDWRPSIRFETWRMRGDEPMAIDPLTVLPQ
ncbi:peptidoglycan DD-metalloendopeptidase family protein [Brevundimonas sp.]|uniref:peptidoglycan DD-metalloendopeptidase family protein n=1 Tax=Brevundimonas sp. TaxID=1871086 RepID=UPI003569A92B